MQTTQGIEEVLQAYTDEFVRLTELTKEFLQVRYPEKDFYGPAEIIENMKSDIQSAGKLADIVKRNKELEARNAELEAELAAYDGLEADLPRIWHEDKQRIAELEAELAALRKAYDDVLDVAANRELRLKAELAKHTAANVIGSRHKEGGLVICEGDETVEQALEREAKEAPEKHPFDSGLVAVRYEEGGREIAAWTSTEYYREFTSHFQRAGYLVKPASEVEVRDDRKDYFVKNAWKLTQQHTSPASLVFAFGHEAHR